MSVCTITKEEEIETIVSEVLSMLPQQNTAVVLALSGPLGAGKTTFVKVLARQLGITEHVTSPTFVLMKSYNVSNHPWIKKLVHVDVYRIEGPDEVQVLNLPALYEEAGSLICIEWAERIKKYIPKDALTITIEHSGGETRKVTYGT